ncbi:MAG: hypothetical protein ACRCXZ_09165 [Patescibacteria group bacterium]
MSKFQLFCNIASELHRSIIKCNQVDIRNNSLEIAINLINEAKDYERSIEFYRFSELVNKQLIDFDKNQASELESYILNEGLIRS